MVARRPKRIDRLLGDGPHPAPQRGRHDPARSSTCCCCAATSASPAPASARCAATPTCRATARWASGSSRRPSLPRRARARSSASTRRASTAATPSTRSAPCATARRRCSSRMGGNFVARHARHRRHRGGAARAARLTVQVSTKLNRVAPRHRRAALILPRLGRTERDVQAAGEQFVTVEDSMGVVHASRGRLRAGVASTCAARSRSSRGLAPARARRPDAGRLGRRSRADYDRIRDHIAARRPRLRGLQRARRASPAASPARTRPRDARTFPHRRPARRSFTVQPAPSRCSVPPGRLLLQTIRSHDQYNTTIYGLDDRYRGIKRRPPRGVREPGRPRRRSGSPTARRRPGERVDGRPSGGAERVPGRRLPDRAGLRRGVLPGDQRAGAARQRRRDAATRRRRSPSWSAWSRSPDRPARRSPVHRRLHDDGGLTGVCTTTRRGTYRIRVQTPVNPAGTCKHR